MIKLNDLVTLASAGWTPKQVKEVIELISTSESVNPEAAPEELKKEAEIKTLEKLPEVEETKHTEEDPIEALKKLISED